MRLLGFVFVCMAVVALASPATGAADGASVTEVGWWTRQPGAPPAPDGGFQVARLATTDTSVAALRIDSDAAVSRVVLQLAEEARSGVSEPVLRVCSTGDDWEAANPGAFDAAPVPDCAQEVALAFEPSVSRWTADVTAMLSALRASSGGSESVMVVPAEEATGPGFEVAFKAAAVEAELVPAPAPEPAAPPPTSAPAPVTTAPRLVTPAAPTPPPVRAPLVAEPPEPAPLAPSAPSATVTTTPTAPASLTVSSDDEPGRPWWRLVLVVPLAALGGLGFAVGRRLLLERGWAGQPA